MHRLALTAVALVLATGLTAQAQTPAPTYSPEVIMAYMDADGDGKVSLNDYLNRQLPNIAKFDADADGLLNFKEFKESLVGTSAKQNADRSFGIFDSEAPRGKLTQREFLGYHAYIFKTFFDTDHDGIMSLKEWTWIMGKGK